MMKHEPFEIKMEEKEASQINVTIHDRPITDLQFNRDGDLIFASSKDATASLIRPEGEVIGTYDDHNGAILSLDVSQDTATLATGGSDKKVILWDVVTGKKLAGLDFESMVRSVQHQKNTECILFACDDSFGKKPVLGLIDKRTKNVVNSLILTAAPTKAISDFSDNFAIFSDGDGFLRKVDLRTNTILMEKKIHTSRIANLKNSYCSSFFITSSLDAQAKIVTYDLEEMRCFVSQDPINSAAIFRTNDKVISGGGINARDVTLTRIKSNFSVNLYDIVTSENIGNYSTHFGTINCVDIHPSGNMYASGGEEGIVCMVNFGDDLNTVDFTELKE